MRGILGRPSVEERIDEDLADKARNLAVKLNGILGTAPYNRWREDDARKEIFKILLRVKHESSNKS
jgi:hypothetical protein